VKISLLPPLLLPSAVTKLARETGWLARKQKVCSPLVFVEALVSSVSCGYRSFREIATEIGLLTGKTISKQALSERFNEKGVEFMKKVVAGALREAVQPQADSALRNLPRIVRILVGDSSTIALNRSLASVFPGATNQSGIDSAQLKFQLTLDLLTGRWLQTDLSSYKKPDQSASRDVLAATLKPGDLIIRDLGYTVVETFGEIAAAGAFYLSRHLQGTALFDPSSKQRLELYKLASERAALPGKTFSMEVLMGAGSMLPCRLVFIRVPQEIADGRRRKLKEKAKRKGRSAPTKIHLALQDWSFYVTNLDETQAGNTQLYELYQLRWRVENIFKIAKSQTGLLKIAGHRTNRDHVEMLIWAWVLLMISMGKLGIFRLVEIASGSPSPEVVEASIFKGIDRILQWIAPAIELAAAGSFEALMERLRQQQRYHDCYEKRSRVSMPQLVEKALKLDSTFVLP